MEALYRKYRPKNFDQIIDQLQAKLVLQNALLKNKISHAYIFSGPRGTGKTSVARILAKALNCSNRKGYEPCCECESCLSIDRGTHPDVIELDAASNRGIDEIRKIRDAVGFKPMLSLHKIYIIDEFHMLTREAFNALLKTLEEPPEKVLFVLATTNLERVPQTIISRCQVIEFRNFSEDAILENIRKVAHFESIELHEDAARMIARRASGGMRDALSYLEQIANYADGQVITPQVVEKALGLVPDEIVQRYIKAIRNGLVKEVGELVNEVHRSGLDVDQLLQSSIEIIEEEISRNPSRDLISIGENLVLILRELKYSENRKAICKLLSMNLASKFESPEKIEHDYEIKNKSTEKSEPVEEKKSSKEKSKIEELLSYLKEQGDMAICIALLQSKISDRGDNIEISLLPSQRFQYEYLREKILEVEYLFKTYVKRNCVVDIRLDEDRERRILQKLQESFPGKIRIEE